MSVGIESSLYYLIVQGREDDAIFIFLGSDPAEGSPDAPIAMPVSLELLPTHIRFGGEGSKLRGMPILGRWPGGFERFRQFASLMELEQEGWFPVTKYRICDHWDDYYSPWSSPGEISSNECDGIGQTEVDCDVDTEKDLNNRNSIGSTFFRTIPASCDLNNSVTHSSLPSGSSATIDLGCETESTISQEPVPPASCPAIDIGFVIEDDFNLSMYSIDLGR